MNDPTANGSNDKKFAEKLFYDTDMTGTLTGNAQYNGNINGMMWRRTNNTKKGYNFSYDGLNRLTAADYGTYNGNWAASNANDMGITSYDMNGNINGLTRKDHQGNTLDNFGYTLTGNRLASVSGTLSGSYNYDSNGNLTYDGPRSLTVSYFDELNLPKQYFRNDTSKVDYCYDAQAVKWSKTATRNGTSTTTLYYGPFIYLSGSLSIVLTQEGYYDPASSLYHYYLKDHLGNTRITFHYSGTTPVIDQEVEYYPFGALFTDNTMGNNKYLYNGKELNNEFFENYDYGARFYDPALGRWHSVDPLADAEHNLSFSPYNYCINNPILLIDPNGEDWFYNDQTGNVAYVSSLRQGAEEQMEKGWQWMGANNMFSNGKSGIDDASIIEGSKNFADNFSTDVSYDKDGNMSTSTSASFSGDNAKSFMKRQGFDFKPTQQIRESFEVTWYPESGQKISTGTLTYITEKSSYVPQGSTEDVVKAIGTPMGVGFSRVGRYKISYTTDRGTKFLESAQKFIGIHDQRLPKVYPSLSSYPWDNEVINKFLRRK